MARPKKENTKEELDQKWRKRFNRSLKFQEENANQWDENEFLLYGRLGKEKSDYDLALGWGLAQFLISQIYYQNPEMMVLSKAQEGRLVAKLLTQVCQYDAEEMDLKDAGNLALLDCFPHGYGAIIEDYENEIVNLDDEGDKDVKDQYYMFRRIPSRDILFDSDGIKLDLSDHKYIFVAYYPTIEELKENKEKYKWLPDNIEDSRSARPANPEKGAYGQNTGTGYSEQDPKYKQIRVYEIWDRQTMKKYHFAADKREIIGVEEGWPVKFNRNGKKLYPVTLMSVTQQSKSFYPIPVLDLVAPQLRNMIAVQKFYVTDLKTKWRKWVTPTGFVNQQQVAKITDVTNEDPAIIEIDNDTLTDLLTGHTGIPDLRGLIVPLEDVGIKQDYIIAFQTLMEQIQQILGFSDTARGGLPKTRSAREAMAIKDQQTRRTSKLADCVATFYRQAMEKHVQCLQQTMEISRYVKVVDDYKSLQQFVQYTKDDIKGAFYFDVLTGSSMPKDTDSDKQQFVQFMNMFVPFLQKEGFSIAPIVYSAAEKFHIKNVDDFFRNQKAAAKMVAQILYAVSQGMTPGGKKIPPQALPESASALVQAVLTKEEIMQAGREVEGANKSGPQGGNAAPAGMQGESNASQGGQ